MNFLKHFKKDKPITSNQEFWEWFKTEEQGFRNAIHARNDIEKNFLNPVGAKLNQLRKGYFFLAGPFNDTTVELIITPDGNVKNVVYVEDLVAVAPAIDGWLFTALKSGADGMGIEMEGLKIDADTVSFYAIEHDSFPDEIVLKVVNNLLTEENSGMVTNGTFIYLDNLIGEKNMIEVIDNVTIIPPSEAIEELIPITKLKDYLNWRQKEFVEKYEHITYDSSEDQFAVFQGERDEHFLIATINTNLLKWDNKSSHPWMHILKVEFDGSNNNNLPDDALAEKLNKLEDDLGLLLTEKSGNLNVGRETANNLREIFIASKDYRTTCKVLDQFIAADNGPWKLDYEVFKDKYWRVLSGFQAQ